MQAFATLYEAIFGRHSMWRDLPCIYMAKQCLGREPSSSFMRVAATIVAWRGVAPNQADPYFLSILPRRYSGFRLLPLPL